MTQFLNNIWIALSSENPALLNILMLPITILENYLSMNIFLTIFNVKASKKQILEYVISTLIISRLSANFVLAPFNVLLNYIGIIIFIKVIFKLNAINECVKSFL